MRRSIGNDLVMKIWVRLNFSEFGILLLLLHLSSMLVKRTALVAVCQIP